MKTIHRSLSLSLLFVALAGCNNVELGLTIDRTLTVDTKDTKALPAGDYTMLVKGSLGGAKVTIKSPSVTAKFKISKTAAKKIQKFYDAQKVTTPATETLTPDELRQNFAVNFERTVDVVQATQPRNEQRSCVLGVERVPDGESCSYGPFCRTETVCEDNFGFSCSRDPFGAGSINECTCRSEPVDRGSHDCEQTCHTVYRDEYTYGRQTVNVRDVTYTVQTQAEVVQGGAAVGSINPVVNTVKTEEILSQGSCQ